MSATPSKGRSLDRQITTQDVDCLREAFALVANERKEVITTNELGKVFIIVWVGLITGPVNTDTDILSKPKLCINISATDIDIDIYLADIWPTTNIVANILAYIRVFC